MAKKKGNIFGVTVVYEKKHKGTSQGRITSSSKVKTMNKHKRKGDRKNNLNIEVKVKENETIKFLSKWRDNRLPITTNIPTY